MSLVQYVTYHSDAKEVSSKIHVHTTAHEIWHIQKGEGVFLIDNVPYQIQKDMMVLVSSMSLHCIQLQDHCTPIISKTSFDADYFNNLVEQLQLSHSDFPFLQSHKSTILLLNDSVSKQIDSIFQEISDAFHSESLWKTGLIFADLIKIVVYCIRSSTMSTSMSPQNTHISRILDAINFDISDQRLSLDLISKNLFLSKYYICRLFKDKLNTTVMEYITLQRISLAKIQLIQTNKKISEISESCGFSSVSFFSRKFQEKEGMSALQYRKKVRMN